MTMKVARNDLRRNLHCLVQLFMWGANCDMQIILDEEAAVRYVVKYAMKPEKQSCDAKIILVEVMSRPRQVEGSSSGEDVEKGRDVPVVADDIEDGNPGHCEI